MPRVLRNAIAELDIQGQISGLLIDLKGEINGSLGVCLISLLLLTGC